ncbi:MAG TPA: DUF721 domain-containing protein [Vicinamibacteria bacterium]|nr:DUF721 domain-containing protein [Vicinamibacteria bacterium]
MGFARASTRSLRLFPAGSPQALALLRACWPKAVGPELARRTEVVSIEGQTLRVRVSEGAWRKSLHRLERQVLTQLHSLAGDLVPRRLGFVDGPPSVEPEAEPPRAELAPSDPPSAPPSALVSQSETIEDPEIRRLFLSTAARYLARSGRRS